MHKKKDLKEEMSEYTFNGLIEIIENTEGEEEKRFYVERINIILQSEQSKLLAFNN